MFCLANTYKTRQILHNYKCDLLGIFLKGREVVQFAVISGSTLADSSQIFFKTISFLALKRSNQPFVAGDSMLRSYANLLAFSIINPSETGEFSARTC